MTHSTSSRFTGRMLAAYLLFLLPFTIGHLVGGTMSQHLVPVSELLAALLRSITMGSIIGVVSAVVFWFVGVRGTNVSPAVSRTGAQ